MRIVVTGAAGFIGRAVVQQAIARGHHVVAVVRPSPGPDRYKDLARDGVTIAHCDLAGATAEELVGPLRGADTVIHLAVESSAKGRHQTDATALVTRNILSAMSQSGTPRIVLASSFSVYDYASIPSGSVVNEQSPLISETTSRDAYSHSKLLQELLVREYASNHNLDARILRLGVVYGPKHTWTARLGWKLSSRLWLRVGSNAAIPLSYVEHSAEALLLAAEAPNCAGLIVNVLDDVTPSQADYTRELSRRISPRPLVFPIPWKLLHAAGSLSTKASQPIPFVRRRLPSILNPNVISARFKPFVYTNRQLHELLGWKPRLSPSEALDACFQSIPARQSTGDAS